MINTKCPCGAVTKQLKIRNNVTEDLGVSKKVSLGNITVTGCVKKQKK